MTRLTFRSTRCIDRARTRWRSRRQARSDAGVVTLTTVIVAGSVLWLMFLVVQGGIYWHTRQWAQAAADRAVARATEYNVDDRESVGRNAADSFLADSRLCNDFSVTYVDVGNADVVSFEVTCRVEGPLSRVAPRARVRAAGEIERFVPETAR